MQHSVRCLPCGVRYACLNGWSTPSPQGPAVHLPALHRPSLAAAAYSSADCIRRSGCVCATVSAPRTGTALDGVQAALTEMNGEDLPRQNGKPFADVAREFVRAWHGLGFELHVCTSAECLGAPVIDEAGVLEYEPGTILNMVAQRPNSPTLNDAQASLGDLPPRADARCTGAPRGLCGGAAAPHWQGRG